MHWLPSTILFPKMLRLKGQVENLVEIYIILYMHMLISYYILNTAHCTLHVFTALCKIITSHCKHPKLVWVGLKIYMAKCTLIYQSFDVLKMGAVHILRIRWGSFCQNMTIDEIYLVGSSTKNMIIWQLGGGDSLRSVYILAKVRKY